MLFRWGTPDYLLTDNGREFDNKDLRRILEVYGVARVTTPPYHPQANPVETAVPATMRPPVLEYFEAVRHLPRDLQAVLQYGKSPTIRSGRGDSGRGGRG